MSGQPSPYWDVLASPKQERDFGYAFENRRFSDYTLKVTATCCWTSQPHSPVAAGGATPPLQEKAVGRVGDEGPFSSKAMQQQQQQWNLLEVQTASSLALVAGSPVDQHSPNSAAAAAAAAAGSSSPSSGNGSSSSSLAWDEAGEPEKQVFRVPVNSAVVSSRSLYFREAVASGRYEKTRCIPMDIHREELPPLMLALRWLYGGELRYECTPLTDLVQLLLMADRLQAPSLVRAIIQHCKRRRLSLESALMLLDLPEHLEPLAGGLMDMAADCVEARFMHLDLMQPVAAAATASSEEGQQQQQQPARASAAADEKLRAQFLGLTWRAMAVILYSPKVTACEEDTVFSLLQSWREAQGIEPEAFDSLPYRHLLGGLRYAYFAPEYLNEAVTPSRCTRNDYAHRLINEGTVFRTAPASFRQRLVAEADHIRFTRRPSPPPEVLARIKDLAATLQQQPATLGGTAEAAGGAAGTMNGAESGGVGSLLSMFQCYLWGPVADTPDTPPAVAPGKKAGVPVLSVRSVSEEHARLMSSGLPVEANP